MGGANELMQMDRELVTDAEVSKTQHLLHSLIKLFKELDADSSDTISVEEFVKYLSQHQVQAYFRSLGLDVTNPREFFSLVDVDDNKELAVSEFIMGCMRLRGTSTTTDMEK